MLYAIADSHFEGPSSRKSLSNVFPLCIGMIVGFALYGIFFGLQLMSLNNNVYARHNETLQVLNDRLLVEIKEKEACLDDDSMALKLAALQGTLMGQEALKQRYENLLLEFESTRQTLETVKEESRIREKAFGEQSEIIAVQAREMYEFKENIKRLQEAETRLREENEDLNRRIHDIDDRASEWTKTKGAEYESLIGALEQRMQRRENFLCREEYGDGPYYVQVSQTPNGTAGTTLSFIIEVASRHDLPHTVYTFLTLVSYGMLDRSAMITTGDDALRIVPGDVDVSFDAKREAVGMTNSILMFEQRSPVFECDEGSVKFHDFGPALSIHLSAVSDASCFGKIVKGLENVRAVQASLASGNPSGNINFQYLKV